MALLHIHTYSHILGRNVRVDAVVPEREPGPWKSLLLLHGLTDDHSLWQRRSSIERYAEERGIAVLMPTTKLGFYTNTKTGERWQDYIFDELLQICRRMLPKLSHAREDNFVAGLSMGGYGALKCALTKADCFSKAAIFSAAVDAHALAQMPHDDPPMRENYMLDIFGPVEKIPGSENDLFYLAEELKENRPELYIWCGTEDFLYDMNIRMRDHLVRLGYDVMYTESPGGHHWKHWDREVMNALNWMLGKEEWKWV